ncbi:MAG: hypothetical protein KA433_05155 [Fermentimonas sp.]|jgi:hypothetical protein|nr:hypothetical protein [Fermentimonas sp.]MBP6196887.1 hypothetical protein [Fermentimonas sp.]MBP7104193.1 hypothetical protein [Fermentimonas sp.]MCK9501848.1 DUF5683 domain-containing protein [Lascolabacillus sp.]
MKVSGLHVFLLFIFYSAGLHAQIFSTQQQTDSLQIVAKDSTFAIEGDSVEFDVIDRKSPLLLPETYSDKFSAPMYMFKPTPRKAVIYSAIFPGLGQIYNRKYWKLPILYGGFVGFTYAITWNNGYYRDYLGGYQDIMDSNPETNRWQNLLPFGMDPESVDQKWFTDVLQQRKDYYRYYRDLSIIGTFALYLLAIVDSYVDAQLFDFDMSPDLSMRIEPALLREERPNYMGSSYGLQWSINF